MAHRQNYSPFPLKAASEKDKILEAQTKQKISQEEAKVLQVYFKNEETYRKEFAFYFNSLGKTIAPAARLSQTACAQFISTIVFGDSEGYLDRSQIGFGWLSLNSRLQEKISRGQATTRSRAMDLIIAEDLTEMLAELSADQKSTPKNKVEEVNPELQPPKLSRLHSGEYHFTNYHAKTKVNFAASCALGTYDPTWKHHDHSEVRVSTVKPGTKALHVKAHPDNKEAPRLYAKSSYELVMHLTEEKGKVVVNHIKTIDVKAVVPVFGEIDLSNCEITNQKIPVDLTFHHSQPGQIGLSTKVLTKELDLNEMKASKLLKKIGETLLSWFASNPVSLQGTFVKKSSPGSHGK